MTLIDTKVSDDWATIFLFCLPKYSLWCHAYKLLKHSLELWSLAHDNLTRIPFASWYKSQVINVWCECLRHTLLNVSVVRSLSHVQMWNIPVVCKNVNCQLFSHCDWIPVYMRSPSDWQGIINPASHNHTHSTWFFHDTVSPHVTTLFSETDRDILRLWLHHPQAGCSLCCEKEKAHVVFLRCTDTLWLFVVSTTPTCVHLILNEWHVICYVWAFSTPNKNV